MAFTTGSMSVSYTHLDVYKRQQQFCEKALRSLAAFDTMIADVQCALRGTDHFHAACKRILWLLHKYDPVRPAADAVKAVGLGKVSRLAGKQLGQHTSGKDISQIGKQQAQGIDVYKRQPARLSPQDRLSWPGLRECPRRDPVRQSQQ